MVKLIWNQAKNRANQGKHGIAFEEASALFEAGTDYLEIYDEEHSDDEDRFIAIGPIRGGIVVVVTTEWNEDVLRVISARWATLRERAMYFRQRGQRP